MREGRGRRIGWRPALGVGLALSAGLHAVVLGSVRLAAPEPAPDRPARWYYLEIPTRIPLPPPPAPVERPPPPRLPAPVRAPALRAPAQEEGPAPVRPPEPPRIRRAPGGRPSFVSTDVPPLLERASEVEKEMVRYYPVSLRRAGVEGRVDLDLLVGPHGRVLRVRIAATSGSARLDRAGVEVAHHVSYLPALLRDRAVSVWVHQTICFVLERPGRGRPGARDCPRRPGSGSRRKEDS